MMKDRSRQIAEEKTALMDLIGPWLDHVEKSKASNEDKEVVKKEVSELGKFIVASKRKIQIDKVEFKSPKLIVSRNRSRVAVELFDMDKVNDSKKEENISRSIFDSVESDLITDLELFKGVYDIQFKEGVELFENRKEITQELIAFIRKGDFEAFSEFVKSIKKSDGETVYVYSEISEEGVTLMRSEIESVLAEKEKAYIKNQKAGIESHWLILVLGGVQDINDYMFLENDVMSQAYESSFDKVFLFDSFSEDIIELK